mgnify:CR=1 FL=1
MKRKKQVEPKKDTMLLRTMPPVDCPAMIFYKDVYFSKDAFAKQVYVGVNGVFLVIPLFADDLEAEPFERKQIKKVLSDICEILELHLFIYPILVGEERSFYLYEGEHLLELEHPSNFLTDLYHYTLEHRTEPSKIPDLFSEIKGYQSSNHLCESVLDERTVERLLKIITPLEGIECPCDMIRYDIDGTKYIQKDSEFTIGQFSTGFIGKKKWYRVSDISSEKFLFCILFGGTFGIHKFMTGEVVQGLFYLFTSGLGGVLPIFDVVSLFLGSYSYHDTMYMAEKCGIRQIKEKVYIEPCKGIGKAFVCIEITSFLSLWMTYTIYTKLLDGFIWLLTTIGIHILEL